MRSLFLLAFSSVAVALAAKDDDSKNRPVSKVVSLLKDMQAQLQKEQEEDEDVYDKLNCWCTTGNKEKTAAIAEAEERINALTASIEEETATMARLETEIKNLEQEIAANEEALNQATAIREKERAAFHEENKDMLQSIQALKAAVVVLSKHNAAPEALMSISTMLGHQMRKYSTILKLSHKQRKVVQAFVQEPDFMGKSPTFKQGYGNQSGEIFGVLNNMLDNFQASVEEAQKEEAAQQKSYDELKAAKEAELAAANSQKDTKSAHLADAQEALAQAKQDITDTRNSLGADQKYLMDLKVKCQESDAEWEERQKTRSDEIQAVSQAIAVLSNDDAHDTFTRTFNNQGGESFLQTSILLRRQTGRRARAASVLLDAAKKTGDAALVKMATTTKLAAFTRVKEAIDNMVTQLIKQKQDEVQHKDWCVGETNKNERETQTTTRDKNDLEVKIDQLTSQIAALKKEIAVLTAEIADLNKEIQRAGEDREKENLDFQTTIKDQQATQQLIMKAITVLKAFYQPKPVAAQAALVQEPAGPPPPPGFKQYENNKASNGVISLMEEIHRDAVELEKDAIKAEQDSQAAYETFVKDSNASIEAKQRSITNKTENEAEAASDLETAKEDHTRTMTALAGQLRASCDFYVKNFDMRQAAFDQEVEALKQAKAILSGMK